MISSLERIHALLSAIYPTDQVEPTYQRIVDLIGRVSVPAPSAEDYFSERNITLITYGDSLRDDDEPPLQTLRRFVQQHLHELISTVHILPFYPYSSDDGFSVIDYSAVNPELGTWDDIRHFGSDVRLMFDAVINHMSAKSAWFRSFLNDEPEASGLFFTENPKADLSKVIRPRTSPLLTPFRKADGSLVHVWTTFSADQVDLDFRTPDTLLRILSVLMFYVEQGAQVIRLDAIAFMWKEVGTNCLHRLQTHALIQLIRAVLDDVGPHVVLITETNVPHAENIAYFSQGDTREAQLVYNFTLPPLLMYSMVAQDVRSLVMWLNALEPRPAGTAYFNFTASHDGIGVRPVEDILDASQLQLLIDKTQQSGGRVSFKANPDGSRSPYELNITYFDAVTNPTSPVEEQVACFLVTQAIMLALAGVPAIYIHSLLGSRNDLEGVRQFGHNRAINRKKLSARIAEKELSQSDTLRAQVFAGYAKLIHQRKALSAFHPNAIQQVRALNDGQVLMIERASANQPQRVICLFNCTPREQVYDLPPQLMKDVLSDKEASGEVRLRPYQTCWLI